LNIDLTRFTTKPSVLFRNRQLSSASHSESRSPSRSVDTVMSLKSWLIVNVKPPGNPCAVVVRHVHVVGVEAVLPPLEDVRPEVGLPRPLLGFVEQEVHGRNGCLHPGVERVRRRLGVPAEVRRPRPVLDAGRELRRFGGG